ncbi:hypothetical protein IWW38_005097, partial [Coemansia aciculifera]
MSAYLASNYSEGQRGAAFGSTPSTARTGSSRALSGRGATTEGLKTEREKEATDKYFNSMIKNAPEILELTRPLDADRAQFAEEVTRYASTLMEKFSATAAADTHVDSPMEPPPQPSSYANSSMSCREELCKVWRKADSADESVGKLITSAKLWTEAGSFTSEKAMYKPVHDFIEYAALMVQRGMTRFGNDDSVQRL